LAWRGGRWCCSLHSLQIHKRARGRVVQPDLREAANVHCASALLDSWIKVGDYEHRLYCI